MSYNQYDWLYENGGPAIRLRLRLRNLNRNSTTEVENIVTELWQMDEVQKYLNYLKGFNIKAGDKKALEHLIHYYGDMCIDKFFPVLMDFGFRSGIREFDQLLLPAERLFMDLQAEDYDYSFFYRLMLHRVFFITGFVRQEMIESMKNRINALHIAAKEKRYDIFQDKSKLPKPPKQWSNHGIMKDEMNPFSEEARIPLPTIYDISAIAYFQQYNKDPIIQGKIDDIIDYILTREFQAFPEGYGLLWVKERRIYHACGWNPMLPVYDDYKRPGHIGSYAILNYLTMMSYYKSAVKSEWFIHGMDEIDQFKTQRETYLFPKEYLSKKCSAPGFESDFIGFNTNKHEIYLNAANMRLKYNERETLIRELISTLNILEIKERIKSNI